MPPPIIPSELGPLEKPKPRLKPRLLLVLGLLPIIGLEENMPRELRLLNLADPLSSSASCCIYYGFWKLLIELDRIELIAAYCC